MPPYIRCSYSLLLPRSGANSKSLKRAETKLQAPSFINISLADETRRMIPAGTEPRNKLLQESRPRLSSI